MPKWYTVAYVTCVPFGYMTKCYQKYQNFPVVPIGLNTLK